MNLVFLLFWGPIGSIGQQRKILKFCQSILLLRFFQAASINFLILWIYNFGVLITFLWKHTPARAHLKWMLLNFVSQENIALVIKGQIISKGLFVILEFSQKRTNEFVVVVKTNSFVRFLGEFEDTKSSFENIWPLRFMYFTEWALCHVEKNFW